MPRPIITAKVQARSADRGFKRIIKNLEELKALAVQVGYFQEQKHPEGEFTLANIAAVNEFGTNSAGKNKDVTIPSRPFMAMSFDLNLPKLIALRNKLYAKIILDKTSVKAGLNALGLLMGGYITSTISNVNILPRNAPSTVAKKGSEHALIDTGYLKTNWKQRIVKASEAVR